MLRSILISIMLILGAICAEAQHYDRGYETVQSEPFVRKGTWSLGGTARYSQHVNEKYNILVISNIDSEGYNFAVRPAMMYSFKDNMAAGLKFSYQRSMLDLANADLGIASVEMNASDCYQIQHTYSAYGVFRSFIPFGNSKRVAMFADLHLGGSFSQGKSFNAGGNHVEGTYGQTYSVQLGVDPGLIAFLTDKLAVEMNVGVFGVKYSWTDQVHNQVDNGSIESASAGFMINLLSLGVGISYYFL